MAITNGIHPCATPWCRANALPDDVWCDICAAMHHKPKPAPTEAYEATCLACGDAESLRLTPAEYSALKPMRCGRCGGLQFVERTFETSLSVGSASSRHNSTVHYSVATGRVA